MMKEKYCIECIKFNRKKNYCYEFEIAVTSIGNAKACSGYVAYKEEKDSEEKRDCTKCSRFNRKQYFCREFQIPIISVSDAEICWEYTTEKEVRVTNKVKCSECKNRVFDSYCKEHKITIRNIRKLVECDKYIEKVK